MKVKKLIFAAVTFFVLSIGAVFYANSALNNDAACDGGTASATACGKCGDGYCNPRCGETAKNCPRDCGVTAAK